MPTGIDKEKLMEAVNALSKTEEVFVTYIEIFGQDDTDGNYLEIRLPGMSESVGTGFEGETYDEILADIVREINATLEQFAKEFLDNKLILNQEGA